MQGSLVVLLALSFNWIKVGTNIGVEKTDKK